jgi:hypothetical protein
MGRLVAAHPLFPVARVSQVYGRDALRSASPICLTPTSASPEARDRLAKVVETEGLSLRAYRARLAGSVLTPHERAAEKAKSVLNEWTGDNLTEANAAAVEPLVALFHGPVLGQRRESLVPGALDDFHVDAEGGRCARRSVAGSRPPPTLLRIVGFTAATWPRRG